MVYVIIFLCIFFVLWVIALNFDGKVKDLSSKDKTPLISLRPAQYRMMFMLYCFLLSLMLLSHKISIGSVHIAAILIGYYVLLPPSIFVYFKIGRVNFYDDEIEFIPFLGNKKIFKYQDLFFYTTEDFRDLDSGFSFITIMTKKKIGWSSPLLNYRNEFCSLVTTMRLLFYKNTAVDFNRVINLLKEKSQNIWQVDGFGYKQIDIKGGRK